MANILYLFRGGARNTTIYFPLSLPTTTGAPASTFLNQLVAGLTFAAGDVQVSFDGGAFQNTTNLPTDGTNGLYSLALVGLNDLTQTRTAVILIKDQTATRAWEDLTIIIESVLALTNIDVNVANSAYSNDAVKLTVATGNGDGLEITGRGTGLALQTVQATTNTLLHNLLDVIQPAEPTTVIGSTSTAWQILQHLYRRFYNKVTQTSSTQSVYKDDSTTVLQTMPCSSDGTTQSKGKAV